MGWSFEIARIQGISIKVHITFFIIVFLFASQWFDMTNGSAAGATFGIILVLLLFVCVTLHELGHSLVAQRFGIPVREITLLPLGGISQISKNPDTPLHDLLIAAAGPIVNIVIALLLALVLGAQSRLGLLNPTGILEGTSLNEPSFTNLLVWLTAANFTLAVFNLIPAFPLDGGRILRALLAMPLGYPRATAIASLLGQLLAIALGIFAFAQGDWLLLIVALFVFVGAGAETSVATSKTVLATQKVGDVYNKNALVLVIGDRVSKAVDYILTSYQPDYAVMQGSKPIGIVTRNDVLQSLASNPDDLYVQQIMQRDILKLDAGLSLEDARKTMIEKACRVAAVFSGETYLGLISLEDISEAFTVLTFWQRQQRLRQRQSAQADVKP